MILFCTDYTAIECPPLGNIDNGRILYHHNNTNITNSSVIVGTVATYECTGGYVPRSTRNLNRTCTIDDDGMDTVGIWTNEEPSCVGGYTQNLNFNLLRKFSLFYQGSY